jgi:hypothetical protein
VAITISCYFNGAALGPPLKGTLRKDSVPFSPEGQLNHCSKVYLLLANLRPDTALFNFNRA